MEQRIAINGFGRIGRVVLRILFERMQQKKTNLRIVAINDTSAAEDLAYLVRYDSVHGRYKGSVQVDGNALIVDGHRIEMSTKKDPAELSWKALGVNIVLEATGHFLSKEQATRHVMAGAKKVLISAPGKGDLPDATICYGVNHQVYQKDMTVISTASCTTNCIAPVAKILHQAFGIEKASVTTIHSYTNDQHLLDLPHKDKRRARAAALSMIPTSTGAAEAMAYVMPELTGKFQGMAVRVPTPDVSCIDMVAMVKKKTSVKEVNEVLRTAAENTMRGIMDYTEDPVVSVDMLQTYCSSIVDAQSTMVLGGDMVKILSWYDNEWGFANRACDLLELMAQP